MLELKHIETSGPLPTESFQLFEGAERVGFLQVRHRTSHGAGVPESCASHVYYEIEASWRGRGYGKELLKLALGEAKRIGLHEVIVTCDSLNAASKRIIESNGGVYTGSCACVDGTELLRYRFTL